MSTDYRFKCDGPECEHFHETQYPVSAAFILVREPCNHGAATEFHFCGWDCVLKFAGQFEPPEIVPVGDGE